MSLKLKNVLEHYITVKPDKELYEKIKHFRLNWAQKSDMYVEFLGNGLTGVQPVRFSQQDEDMLYDFILGCNSKALQNDIYKCGGINKSFKVSSNATHIALTYIIHLFLIDKKLPEKTKIDAIKETYYVLAYKFLSSLLSHYFKYDLDVAIAKAVYERMTQHFLLKKLGTWQNVLEYRTMDVLPKGIHFKRLQDVDADDFNRVISDLQGKIRELIKNTYLVLMEVIEQNEKVNSRSLLTETESGTGIRDGINMQREYINYILDIYKRPNEFINSQVLELTISLCSGCKTNQLSKILEYISSGKHKNIENILEETIVFCINIAAKKGFIADYKRNIAYITSKLRGYLTSSNINDPELREIKKNYDVIVKKGSTITKRSTLSALNTSTVLYIFLRAIFNSL